VAVIVTAEGHEISGGEPGGRGADGDLLAERRARRAAESGDTALVRRAETAEATVQTLETHVASLQQRLEEAEQERQRVGALLTEGEHELRRAKQREYAEQQLRVEAEDRRVGLDRESRAEIGRLSSRLSSSERDARELTRRLESVQRELAETEQAVMAERASVRRAERELKERLTELERRAIEIRHGLDAERAARERSELLLESMRRGHRKVEAIVGELRAVVQRLRASTAATPSPPEQSPQASQTPQGSLMLQAPQTPPDWPAAASVERAELAQSDPQETVRRDELAEALAAAVERLRARAQEYPVEHPVEPPASTPRHKHSLSLIARWRRARKQRRER
jgi:chromosome segregation ATPase